MDTISCKRCKRLFISIQKHSICPQCEKEIDSLFIKVRDFLHENPSSSLDTVVKETEVSMNLIQKFIKEGKLILSKDSPIQVFCEKCNAPILSGKFCSVCSQKIITNIEGISKAYSSELRALKTPQKTGNKMRFLGK